MDRNMNKVNAIYKNIFDRVKSSTIFNEPINLDSPEQIAVAFYYLAKMEERNGFQKERDIYEMRMNLQDTRMEIMANRETTV